MVARQAPSACSAARQSSAVCPSRRASARSVTTTALASFALIAGWSAASRAGEASVEALFAWPGFTRHAHSHNDYHQTRPLLDAIGAGVNSVEADIFLEGKTIRVAHHRGNWRGDFETLYLQPLNALWESKTLPTRSAEPFLLWLDLKEGSAALRTALHQLLSQYPVTRRVDPARARVEVILTGNDVAKKAFVAQFPSESVTRDSNSFSDADEPAFPAWRWYALDWSKLATWTGEGEIPAHERRRLRELVAKIHGKGRKLRFWKHPATLSFWKEAAEAGVDRLGTDLLPVTPLAKPAPQAPHGSRALSCMVRP